MKNIFIFIVFALTALPIIGFSAPHTTVTAIYNNTFPNGVSLDDLTVSLYFTGYDGTPSNPDGTGDDSDDYFDLPNHHDQEIKNKDHSIDGYECNIDAITIAYTNPINSQVSYSTIKFPQADIANSCDEGTQYVPLPNLVVLTDKSHKKVCIVKASSGLAACPSSN